MSRVSSISVCIVHLITNGYKMSLNELTLHLTIAKKKIFVYE